MSDNSSDTSYDYATNERRKNIPKVIVSRTNILTLLSVVLAISIQTVYVINWASTFKADFLAQKDLNEKRFQYLESIMNEKLESNTQIRDQKIFAITDKLQTISTSLESTIIRVENRLELCEKLRIGNGRNNLSR